MIHRLKDDEMWTAYVIRMKYNGLAKPCSASLVYFLPYDNGAPKPDMEILQNCIAKALEEKATKINISKRNIEYSGMKENIRISNDNGRPFIKLIVHLTAEIPSYQWEEYSNKEQNVPEYTFKLNLFLDFLGEPLYEEDMVRGVFPLQDDTIISWGAQHYESL